MAVSSKSVEEIERRPMWMLPVKRHLTDILTMTIFHFTHKILVKLALPGPLGMHRMECGAD